MAIDDFQLTIDYCISHRAAGHTEKTEGSRRGKQKRQKTDVSNQRTEDRGQRGKIRRQQTEVRCQRTEDPGEMESFT